MIQVRKGIYETNSSSANVFVVPKDDDIELQIPSTIDFNNYYPDDSVEYRICLLHSYLQENNQEVLLEKYLEEKGVTIIHPSSDDYPTFPGSDIFDNEKQLDKFLFGNDVVEVIRRCEGSSTEYRRDTVDTEKYDLVRFDW